ncbi:hypothetical protein N7519_005116 [Penicillium mononematosum]|uniref:uncharacterized protein n=1 Tax=Penicillium mononematosum TaxID=268346 RepID=UPI0025495CA7|nr:uncharacterized protein N7519_005116 [Penicillium mononematosum]KAJ6183815.1 hypothetical protein N7519_005116 [Penicillium mononematosum]
MNVEANDVITRVQLRGSVRWAHAGDSHAFLASHSVYSTLTFPCHSMTAVWKTGLPVRSAVLKPHAGELVVGWVTTSESSLLYVFFFLQSPIVGVGQVGLPISSPEAYADDLISLAPV